MGSTTSLGWRYSFLSEPFRRQQFVDLAEDIDDTLSTYESARAGAVDRDTTNSLSSRWPGGGFDTQVTVTVGTSALIPYAYNDGGFPLGATTTELSLAEGLYLFEANVFRGTPSGSLTNIALEVEVGGTSRYVKRFLTAGGTSLRVFGVYPATAGQTVRVRASTTGTAGVTTVMWGQIQATKLVNL